MKKILICSTKGGGGHIIVSEALTHYLKSEYCVETISIFDDTLSSLDLIKILSLGTYNWIQLYDDLIVHKYFRTLNVCKTLGAWYLSLRHKSLVTIITSYLQKHKPDMVISVVPLINAALIHRSSPAALNLIQYFINALEIFYSTEELSILLEEQGYCDVSAKAIFSGMLGCHRARKPMFEADDKS